MTKETIGTPIASIQLIRFIREVVMEGELDSQNERVINWAIRLTLFLDLCRVLE